MEICSRASINMFGLADSLVLGSFADLEWLGDFSWNLGCIMISKKRAHPSDVFRDLPLTKLSVHQLNEGSDTLGPSHEGSSIFEIPWRSMIT
jgi:hypothetical protein